MYLLIPTTARRFSHDLTIFTSHYVSINSLQKSLDISIHLHLHPTMYLLIPICKTWFISGWFTFTSHYVSINSYLLFLFCTAFLSFTSHYVSINSCSSCMYLQHNNYLHPTMYLLILFARFLTDFSSLFTSHYVSINSIIRSVICTSILLFTSHYVSINSWISPTISTLCTIIYIPLCIY